MAVRPIKGEVITGGIAGMKMAGGPRIEFRSSVRAWFLQSGQGWMYCGLYLILAGLAIWGVWQYGYAEIILPALLMAYVIPLLIKSLHYRTAIYWLDNERLFIRRGIIMRSEEEIELYRIKDVKVRFSVIQQMFGNGTIVLTSSEGGGQFTSGGQGQRGQLFVPHVRDARYIRGEMRDRVEFIRQSRGVRELDIS